MDSLQRDMGRVEAKVEIILKELEKINKDLGEIKEASVAKKSIMDADWKRLTVFGTVITFINQLIPWIKHLVS